MHSGAAYRLLRRAHWRPLVLLMFLGSLSGCAWLWQPESGAPGGAEREELRAISAWVMEGRIAVRTPDDAWSANLEWRHDAKDDRMALNGPFAQRAATIRYTNKFISFEAADGSRAESADPETLLLERLGFSVPLDALRYWVLALPAPGQEFVPRPSSDTPAASADFDQAGWSLRYGSFMREGRWTAPRKMVIEGRGVVLKLIVDRWRFDG